MNSGNCLNNSGIVLTRHNCVNTKTIKNLTGLNVMCVSVAWEKGLDGNDFEIEVVCL